MHLIICVCTVSGEIAIFIIYLYRSILHLYYVIQFQGVITLKKSDDPLNILQFDTH